MINKFKKVETNVYKVVNTLEMSTEGIYPTVTMEIDSQASLSDHIYAFERFLQSIGHFLPENAHLDFVEDEPESRDGHEIKNGMIVIEGEQKKNGVN
jgi:hypothetical protein